VTYRADLGVQVRQVGSNGSWCIPDRTASPGKDQLQGIIADDPDWVPGVTEDAWAVGEFTTSAGLVDLCIVSPDGSLTLVVCKLGTNPKRGRHVIGQVLDYTSAIKHDGEQAFREQWVKQGGDDLDTLQEDGREQLARNIAEGRIHLCLVVHQIDADLRRMVDYLKLISFDDVQITALQLAYAQHGELEILNPSTYGAATARDALSRSSRARPRRGPV